MLLVDIFRKRLPVTGQPTMRRVIRNLCFLHGTESGDHCTMIGDKGRANPARGWGNGPGCAARCRWSPESAVSACTLRFKRPRRRRIGPWGTRGRGKGRSSGAPLPSDLGPKRARKRSRRKGRVARIACRGAGDLLAPGLPCEHYLLCTLFGALTDSGLSHMDV